MVNPKKEIADLNRDYYLEKYNDVFYIIIYALSGAIHLIELKRWLYNNKPDNAKALRKVIADWEQLGLVNKVKMGRNYVLYMRAPVYNYFHLMYYRPATSEKLKRTSLLMEKFLTEEKYYLKPPSELKNRLLKTNAVLFLASGESHKRIVQNYIKALTPYGWDMTGLNDQMQLMQAHIERSPSNNHFQKVDQSIEKEDYEENLYSLACKGIYLTGGKLENEESGSVTFTVHADIFNVNDIEGAKLANRIMSVYRMLSDMLYDSRNPKHKANIKITVYSHQAEDKKLIDQVYQHLKLNKEFCCYDDDMLKEHVQFVFFNTEKKLFGGYPIGRIV